MGGTRESPGVCKGLSLAVTLASHRPPFILTLFLFLLDGEHSSIKTTRQRAVCGFLFGLAEGRFCLPSTALPAEPQGVKSRLQVGGTVGLLAKVIGTCQAGAGELCSPERASLFS